MAARPKNSARAPDPLMVEPLVSLWTREDREGNRVEIVPRAEMDALIAESGVEVELLSRLVGLALGKYRRLDQRGLKAEMRRDIQDAIEEHLGNEP